MKNQKDELLIKGYLNLHAQMRDIYGENEWLSRCLGLKQALAFDAMEEEDKDVFKGINERISKWERENKEYYVYLTVKVYERMKDGCLRGMKDKVLCAFCDIMPSKLKRLKEKYVKLEERLGVLSNRIVSTAMDNIAKSVSEGDIKTSKWVLEKMDRENFGTNTESQNVGKLVVEHTIDIDKIKKIRGELLSIRDKNTDIEVEGYHDTSNALLENAKKESVENKGVIDI